ncbi:MAG TPA: DJ-1/PfpI family protein, partial [Thermoanaerobaculia bacterium]|nr:DJ-1/PfpI family protein [Thermoanaerobaculia bacterium]
LLISSGLVKGRTITTWPTLQDDMRNAGANWKDEVCIRDRNWVSSRKPDDLPVFDREMVKLFSELQRETALQPGKKESMEVRS